MNFFDPWEAWLGIPLAEQPPDHYRLLGLPRFLPDSPAIDRALASRRTLLMAHMVGPHGDEARRMLAECETAASCLMDARSRMTYDAALRRQLGLDEGPLPLPADAIVSDAPAFSFAATTTDTKIATTPSPVDAHAAMPTETSPAAFSFASEPAAAWSFGATTPSAPAPVYEEATPVAAQEPVAAVVPVEEEASQVVPVDEPVEEAPAVPQKPIIASPTNITPGAPIERPNEALVALWEGAKIVLGGVAGLGAGYLILAFFFPNHSFFGGNGEPEKAPAKPEVVKNENQSIPPLPKIHISKSNSSPPVPPPPPITYAKKPDEKAPQDGAVDPFKPVDSTPVDPFKPVDSQPSIDPSPPSDEGDPFKVIPSAPAASVEKKGDGVDVNIAPSPPAVEPKLPFRDPKSAPPELAAVTPSPAPMPVAPARPERVIEPTANGTYDPIELPPPLGTTVKTLATRAAPLSADTKLELFSIASLGEGKAFQMAAAANSQPPAWRVASPKVAGAEASETAIIGQFLLSAQDLQFQWAKQASEMPFRQLKNSLLKIRNGAHTETIPLRAAVKAKPIVLGFKEKSQSEELQIGDLPRTDSIHFIAEDLSGWPRGARFKGGSRFAKIGQPLVIEMEEFPEIEITCRLIRRDDDTIAISVVPTYEDSPSTKLDFTAQRMNNLKAATEQGLAEAEAALPALRVEAANLQDRMAGAQRMEARTLNDAALKRQAIEKFQQMISSAARRYATLEKRIPVLQKRLDSMPKLEIAMNSMANQATIRYRIVAAMDSDELVLVDARQ